MEAEQTQTQSDAFYNFLAWLDQNKKQVLIGIAVVAAAGLAFGLYSWQKKETEFKANEALFALPSGMMSRVNPPTGDAFLKIADEYAGTSASERAELMGAGALFTERKFDKAQAAFEKFLNDHPNSPLRSQASFGVAACLDAQGKSDLALAKYQEVTQSYRGENVVPIANLSRARILEQQNKPEEALKVYAEFEAPTAPQDAWRTEAIDRREKLLAKNPQLMKKAAPEPAEQVIEVTTPPEGSTNAPTIRVVPSAPEDAPKPQP